MPTLPNNEANAGEELLRAGEKASVAQHLKAHLASLFLRDANDFLWRVDIARQAEFQHRSWYGKIYVDYVMASECALKAAIIFLSPDSESPEVAYQTARSKNHSIHKLLPAARDRASKVMSFVSNDCVAFLSCLPFPVTARYDLELLHAHFATKKGYDSKINDSIRDADFMKKLHLYVFEIVNFARDASKMTSNRNLPIPGTKIQLIQDALTNFKL